MLLNLAEKGFLPDFFIRVGIRKLLLARLQEQSKKNNQIDYERDFADSLINQPIALSVEKANEQHYELPSEFFLKVLGKRKKYSSCYWPKNCFDLDTAEEEALAITCQRAQLSSGQKILELGCGWGSLSLWMAQHYPQSRILALSNSSSQKSFIDNECVKQNINNLEIQTINMVDFQTNLKFDRIISIEMFEHMRNYELLLKNISTWLSDQGKLFVHVFSHKKYSYLFETQGPQDWMGRYFFTGGLMPSHNLFTYFQNNLKIENQWQWNGTHYQKTSEAWLKNMDHNENEIRLIFERVYGQEASRWFYRWRIFFMACAELFGYEKGNQWGVSHYLFSRQE